MCPYPKRNKRPIYKLVRDPLGILIPTYSREQYERVTRNCLRMAVVFNVLMLIAAGAAGFLLFSIISHIKP
jgi:hypothetical protein